MHDRSPSEDAARFLRRLIVVLSLGILSSGCAAATGWLGANHEAEPAKAELPTNVAAADELRRQGQLRAARDLYARIAAEPERDVEHGRALYSLARLLTDPASELCDYRAAQAAFDRLL